MTDLLQKFMGMAAVTIGLGLQNYALAAVGLMLVVDVWVGQLGRH